MVLILCTFVIILDIIIYSILGIYIYNGLIIGIEGLGRAGLRI